MLSRRTLLGSAALAGAATLAVPATAVADTSTPQGWFDWIARHRDQVGALAVDADGRRVAHRPHAQQVLASTIKVVHLAAYAAAVEHGLNPDEPVLLGDWEAFYPFGGDGGAHLSALRELGIPHTDRGNALDPDATVPLDRLARAMIVFSDNAAADYLRDRLGDRALTAAAARGGWLRPDLRSFCGEVLLLLFPEFLPRSPALRPAAGDRLARRFATEPAFRDEVLARFQTAPGADAQVAWTRGHGRGSAAGLFAMHRALAAGRFGETVVRRHLEEPFAALVPPGAAAVAFKGGSLPRVLTAGMTVRWPGGRAATLALLLDDVADVDFAHQGPFVRAGLAALSTREGFDGFARALRG
ncbi:class A beta-lactamase-related serine hydrolase [Amycolatopsis thermalba]|uniref:Beta-lactamase n=1 Tax=Amycolatopsis thermalba TaxID=944492 RepID=A0ABY4P290_9PSEU|nr:MULTISPECIES: serine hydrolase [Amycolatopsis]UQS26485.1 class A beta-lactamase-related serine hydrolase [Amycolatopsis thermalba]